MLINELDFKKVPHSRVNALRFISRYLKNEPVKGKIIVDVPAGSGFVSGLCSQAGALVEPYDLHPAIFQQDHLICRELDLNETFPIATDHADYVLYMENVESISDQLHLIRELARILKPGGKLVITMPNQSNLQNRANHFWMESERSRFFLPNEYNGIVGYDDQHVYLGRFFLCGVQRLRSLAGLAGLKLEQVHPNEISYSALGIFIIAAPFLYLRSWLALRRNLRKAAGGDQEWEVLRIQHQLNTSSIVLLHKHLCVTFIKPK
jgi:SAM-dependent methyltransferase